MKKAISIVLAVMMFAALLTGCEFLQGLGNQLNQYVGKIQGKAVYFDKPANQNGGIVVRLLGAGLMLPPNKIPLDVSPVFKTTGGNGSFIFDHVAPGTYLVIAEDPSGEYQPANAVVEVGENEKVDVGTLVLTKAVRHVLIFRDPGSEWGNDSTIGDLLVSELGMSEGTGPNQFEYKTSSDIPTFQPSLGDLIIIAGDQPQVFYDTYTTHKAKFDNFVSSGGTIFWVACDMGWKMGNFTSSLPGGATWRDKYENYNDIVYFEHPITKNFPAQLYGNYASHGGFDNLDSINIFNLITLVRETDGLLPTYVEYRFGSGRVLATTAPLEFYITNGYVYYRDLFKIMLIRSLQYIMGRPVGTDVPPAL
ncbi:MAG: carboxypeptidase-like regulatory domain-containing protein [Rectinemataceae bacterium]